jgi:hypothetical protein
VRHVGKAVGISIAASAVLAAASVASPTSLYTALLTTRFAPLPAGYYSAKVGTDKLNDLDKKHHAVGRVLVTIDSDSGVEYAVFHSWQDARDRLKEKAQPQSGGKINFTGKVPGFRIQTAWVNGSITGKNAFGKTVTNGLTLMCARVDITEVCAVTTSVDNEQSGDVPGTIKLLRAGLAHLNAVRGKH